MIHIISKYAAKVVVSFETISIYENEMFEYVTLLHLVRLYKKKPLFHIFFLFSNHIQILYIHLQPIYF